MTNTVNITPKGKVSYLGHLYFRDLEAQWRIQWRALKLQRQARK